MRMNLKKIFVLIICIIIQVTCIVSANEDATQSFGYQNIMHEVRQRNAGVQPIPTQPVTPLATPVTMPVPTPIPTTRTPQGLIVPNSIVIPPIHPTQHPTITMHTYTTERQNMYGEIVESYNKLSKDKDNKNLCANYINSVENYRNTYGDILLKSENRDNYFQIMQRLGLAYKNTSRIDDAIDTYENLLKENPTNINIKKHLLVLYDEATSCIDAENLFSQIRINEPNYNPNLKNCSDNSAIKTENSNNLDIYNNSNKAETSNNSGFTFALTIIFFIVIYIIAYILEQKEVAKRKELEEKQKRQEENERLEQERIQKELEEKRRIQEEYRRRQIENQRREQERKQRELEEQKRKIQERAMRLQKNYWYNHIKDFEFEDKIGEIFQELGYDVNVTQKSSDGGVDVIIKKDNIIKCVQCKHYHENHAVKIDDIRALWGVREDFNASGVIMVTTGRISKKGLAFIEKRKPDYELWTIDTIIAKAKEANYNYS